MRVASLSFAMLAAGCSASAALAKPPPQVWDEVAARLDAAADRDLRDPEDAAPARDAWGVPPAKMFSRVDINRDSVPDWRVDYEHAPNPSLFCGTGGCRNELWVSQPDGGWRRAMGRTAGTLRLVRAGGAVRLDLHFHGSVCDGFGAQDCPRSYLWNEDAGVFEPVAVPGGPSYLAGGPAVLEAVDLASVPAPVRHTVEAMQAACRGSGGALEEPAWAVTRLPDIDGDGLGDWMVGYRYFACDYDGEAPEGALTALPVTVFATAGDPAEPTMALEGKDMQVSLDLASKPAAVWVWREGDAECEYQKPCGRRHVWNAGSRAFEEAR